jgi:hypothetical protein
MLGLKLTLPTLLLVLLVANCERERRESLLRQLSVEELENHLRDRFTLQSVQLTSVGEGKTEGNGTGANGRSYRFEITQSSESRTVIAKWERAKGGDRGESQQSISYTDNTNLYLLLLFVYFVWIGKVIRNQSRMQLPLATTPVQPDEA